MKLKNSCVRTLTCTAVVLGAAAMLSVGAFAAGTADLADPVVAGYLPPQEQMVQGDIALHSADVAIGEKDPTYGGYGAPEGCLLYTSPSPRDDRTSRMPSSA